MRTFLIIWSGQLVSGIGSEMTIFALTIWTWEQTGSATALALIGFFVLLSSIVSTPFLGQLVDHQNRKMLMIVSDTAIALAVLVLLIIHNTNTLQVWHLYVIAAFIGPFSQLQGLTYQSSLSLMVPERHYTRVGSMGMMIFYSSQILSPAFAGVLYPVIGLTGIVLIDLVTFAIAIITLVGVQIPQPLAPARASSAPALDILAGVRYILARPDLFTLLIVTSLFWFVHELADTLVSPMLLARTNGNTTVLGSVASAVGLGGVMGAIVLSFWGGPTRRQGLSLGMITVGISRMVFGVGRSPLIWLPSQFCASLQFPLFGSSEQAIWLGSVEPSLQGQVFAVQGLSQQVVVALATLIAGPLADYVFEPAMMPHGIFAPTLHNLIGTAPGSGMTLLFELCTFCMVLIGVGSYAVPTLRNVDNALATGKFKNE